MSKHIGNVRVGKAATAQDASSHVAGIREANEKVAKQRGLHEHDGMMMGSARRSTGISPNLHETIDPRMPKLQPA